MNLSSKYKPELLTELEYEYPEIIMYLNENKSFIVNGPKFCGKSTIVKLYLKLLNYDYLLIDDFSLSKEQIMNKLNSVTKSVMSFFLNKKFIILIDNFDLFENKTKEYLIEKSKNSIYLIITNKYLNFTIDFVRLKKLSFDYISNLYCNIFFIENNCNCQTVPICNNINQMFSQLELNINEIIEKDQQNEKTEKNEKKNLHPELLYNNNYDFYNTDINSIIKENDFKSKLYHLDKFTNYSMFHINLVYNYNSIEDLAQSYESVSSGIIFHNKYSSDLNEYYSIQSVLYPLNIFNNNNNNNNKFKFEIEQYKIKKRYNFNYK